MTLNSCDKIFSVIPLFSEVSAEKLRALGRVARLRTYRRREHICRSDEPFQALVYLVDGLAQLGVMDPHGKEVGMALVTPGQWFGELSLLDGHYQPATVTVLEPSRALMIPREPFLELVAGHPAIALELLTVSQRRLFHVLAHVKRIQFGDVYQRVARVMLDLADAYGAPCPQGVRIRFRLTHQTLADLTALSRESVSRTFSAFCEAGCLTVTEDHHWVITDLKKCRKEAE